MEPQSKIKIAKKIGEMRFGVGFYKSMASGTNHSSLDRQILQNDDKNDKTH